MRNGAGTRPPSNSGVSGFGCRQPAVRPLRRDQWNCARPAGYVAVGAAEAPGLAGPRDRCAAVQGAGVAGEAEPAAVGSAGGRTQKRAAGARVHRRL